MSALNRRGFLIGVGAAVILPLAAATFEVVGSAGNVSTHEQDTAVLPVTDRAIAFIRRREPMYQLH